jgi:hypothetical protein
MAAIRTDANELARLQAVQARVRTLVQEHGWFADAIRAAYDDYSALVERFEAEESAMRDWERRLARELLADGRLFDPQARDNRPCLIVPVRGLCPVNLAGELKLHGRGDTLPQKLERKGAAAALAAFDRDVTYQGHDLPVKTREAMAAEYRAALDARTHVSFVCRIVVSRPSDWAAPADPRSLDQAHLARFAEADLLTIALHRLGGLADVGALRPIVPLPMDTGNMSRDVKAQLKWSARLPIEDDQGDPIQAPLKVDAFPVEVAEQMLHYVEAWVRSESRTRNESLSGNGQNGPVELAARQQDAAAAVDSGAFERTADLLAEKIALAFGGEKDMPAAKKLPNLGPRDTEAWQASLVAGMTQAKIAIELNRKYRGENWTQPRVSEAIKRAKAHAEASGLADKISVARSRAPARTFDPAAAEQGRRTDGKAHYLRERERQKAVDDDEDER